MLPAFLDGAAGRWYDKQTDEVKNNLDDLKTAMQQKYLTNEMSYLSRTQLANRSQQDGEDVQKFADKIEKMVGRGYAHLGNEARDEMAKDLFLRSLKPDNKNWIWNQTMADFQAAANEATHSKLLVNDFGAVEKSENQSL